LKGNAIQEAHVELECELRDDHDLGLPLLEQLLDPFAQVRPVD
jgi:hypothetical protein